jgi:hypothetical protein
MQYYDSFNEITNRQVRCVFVPTLAAACDVELPAVGHFGACLLLDQAGHSESDVQPVADALLAAGMVYVLVSGPDADMVELWFDHAIVARAPDETEKSVVMTTLLREAPLDEALWHFLNMCFPADDYWEKPLRADHLCWAP